MTRKILIFAGYFYPHVGGYKQVIYELSKRLVKKGYGIDIVTCNTENVLAYEELSGIHIYRLPSWNILGGTYPIPKPNLELLKIFYSLLRKDYDVVNTHTRFFITSFMGAIFAVVKRIPLVHVEHGSTHSALKSKFVSIANIRHIYILAQS